MKLDRAVWLYGSQARGDADSLSDFDVLVVTDNELAAECLASVIGSPAHLSVAQYNWNEIAAMAKYGSLFLRHVQLEGRVLKEEYMVRGRMLNLLSNLPPYSLAARDLKGFKTVLTDVRASIGSNAHLTFELATIATVFRHACILGCAISGRPCFSRFGPVSRLLADWGLCLAWSDQFPKLYAYRLYASGRVPRPAKPTARMANLWCDRAEVLLNQLGVRLNEPSRALPR